MSGPIRSTQPTPHDTAVELLKSMQPVGVSERKRAFANLLNAVTRRTAQ